MSISEVIKKTHFNLCAFKIPIKKNKNIAVVDGFKN